MSDQKKASDVQVGGDHYKQFTIQPAQFSEVNKLTFLEGSAIKRLCRHSRGGKGLQDLEKAIHEIQLMAEFTYGVSIGVVKTPPLPEANKQIQGAPLRSEQQLSPEQKAYLDILTNSSLNKANRAMEIPAFLRRPTPSEDC